MSPRPPEPSLSVPHLHRENVLHDVRFPHLDHEATADLQKLAHSHQLGDARAQLRRVEVVRLPAVVADDDDDSRGVVERTCAAAARAECARARAAQRARERGGAVI